MSHHDHKNHEHHHSHHEHEKGAGHGTVSETDKLTKMVEHWIHHNEEHARSYRDWATRAREMGYQEVYLQLEEVAKGTQLQNRNLEKVLELLKRNAQQV